MSDEIASVLQMHDNSRNLSDIGFYSIVNWLVELW